MPTEKQLEPVELTRQEMEMIRAYAWFAASDAAGEINPPNPTKVERWGKLARKLDTALGVEYAAAPTPGRGSANV